MRSSDVAHYSLVGRADNFLVGMLLAQLESGWRRSAASRPIALAAACLFVIAFHGFNRLGGMGLPSGSPVWIVLPTLESLGFAALIYWYSDPALVIPARLGRVLA